MLVDITWLVLGSIWLVKYYVDCPIGNPKEALLGKLNSKHLAKTLYTLLIKLNNLYRYNCM